MTNNVHQDIQKTDKLDSIGPRIAVVGVGGAGSNAVDNMIRSRLQGVSFLVCNTDAQALSQSLCPENQRVCLGMNVTQGLGAGSCPDNGRKAAEESIQEIMAHLKGVHMVFVTAGEGGGTGTGAAPVIARAAREAGILTVGVVTKPFHFEGQQRMKVAEKGIEEMRQCVDTLLVIPNQNLFRLVSRDTTILQAFAMADEVLYSGVRTFTDIMIKPGLVNSDYADICAVMKGMMGKAMMGTGESWAEGRAIEAAEKAIACLLLDDICIQGAQAILVNVTGGPDLTLFDVDEAVGRIKQEVDPDRPGREAARIIFGATFDSEMEGGIRVSVVATGIMDETAPAIPVPSSHPHAAEGYGSSARLASMGGSNSQPDGYGAHTLGSRHGDYAYDAPSFPAFALNEEAPTFGYEAAPGHEGHGMIGEGGAVGINGLGGGYSHGGNKSVGSYPAGAPYLSATAVPSSAPRRSFLGRLFRRKSSRHEAHASAVGSHPQPFSAGDFEGTVGVDAGVTAGPHHPAPFTGQNGAPIYPMPSMSAPGQNHHQTGFSTFHASGSFAAGTDAQAAELEVPSFLRQPKAPKKRG